MIELYVKRAGQAIAPDAAYLAKQLNKLTKAEIIKRAGQLGISLEPETPKIPAGLSPAQRRGLVTYENGDRYNGRIVRA